jgi:hypothetical protein
MWWCLPLTGFFVGAVSVFVWGARGAIVTLVLGVIVGEGVAFYALFSTPPERMDEYARYPSFAVLAGVVWVVLWSAGGCGGIPVGFALKRLRDIQSQS